MLYSRLRVRIHALRLVAVPKSTLDFPHHREPELNLTILLRQSQVGLVRQA
ncbi:unnamed protein product [Haemonchus placei]|uniref:Uncharacterized protein n=1 Tax=Haemonchus placei TaxID=6290 RepID=A0A3P7WA47_HAEPC|nr:unnamed protein product [Haemonchus placei]